MTPYLKSALDALADHDTQQVWTLVPLLDDNGKDRVMLSAMVHGLDDIAAKIYQSQPHLDDGINNLVHQHFLTLCGLRQMDNIQPWLNVLDRKPLWMGLDSTIYHHQEDTALFLLNNVSYHDDELNARASVLCEHPSSLLVFTMMEKMTTPSGRRDFLFYLARRHTRAFDFLNPSNIERLSNIFDMDDVLAVRQQFLGYFKIMGLDWKDLDDGSCQELMDLLPAYIERQNIQAQVEGGAAPTPRPKKL